MLLTIPHPEPDEDDAEANWRDQLLGGWRFLFQHRPLFLLSAYTAFIYFLINGPLEMTTPYIITITGDERTAGFVLGMLSLGSFLGSISVAIIGTVRRRVQIILFAFLIHGLMFVIYGVVREPLLLGGSVLISDDSVWV